jgi:hypothetical protein
MQVADALTHFEQRLAATEAALDAGEEVVLDRFETTQIDGPATQADVQRLERAMARLRALEGRAHAQRLVMVDELVQLDRRRGAATAYAANT